jgi:lipopolysaccharide transport system ATP-binding protein
MGAVAVHAEGLGKEYRVGETHGYRRRVESFWALKDVSFDIDEGEVVGVIGRNGAGKSTLLKVLSRVTEPSAGHATVRGRTATLLEVGTGFHPELTGRENIAFASAVLGMKRRELAARFDEIVAFAGPEVERFLDTPVKRYSSGMYVRLGFAVAAHLDPDVLIVDEVLAVGDAEFQRRSLARMQDVGAGGRTVIFVSHLMTSITRLCRRVLLLEHGSVVADGDAHDVVATYLRSDLGTTAERRWEPGVGPGNDVARLLAVRVRDHRGSISEVIDVRRPVELELEWEVLTSGRVLVPAFDLTNQEGVRVFVTLELDPAWRRRPRPAGRYVSVATIPGNLLTEGTAVIGAGITTLDPFEVHAQEPDAVAFEVADTLDGDSARGDLGPSLPGVVRPLLEWRTEAAP